MQYYETSSSYSPYTSTFNHLSLHDALPISLPRLPQRGQDPWRTDRHRPQGEVLQVRPRFRGRHRRGDEPGPRSEEHTSELQSRGQVVCRLLLEKKKIDHKIYKTTENKLIHQ